MNPNFWSSCLYHQGARIAGVHHQARIFVCRAGLNPDFLYASPRLYLPPRISSSWVLMKERSHQPSNGLNVIYIFADKSGVASEWHVSLWLFNSAPTGTQSTEESYRNPRSSWPLFNYLSCLRVVKQDIPISDLSSPASSPVKAALRERTGGAGPVDTTEFI